MAGPLSESSSSSDDRPADPASSSSGSPSDANAGSGAASVGNVVAGGVLRDAAQDTVVSGGADGPRGGHDDKEPAKRQRTEKTELEMEASNVAKIKGPPKNSGAAT